MERKDCQIIVAISREFGSGGREIADLLSEKMQIPVYEKNLLQNLGIARTQDVEDLYYRDEMPRWKLTSRTVRGLTNSNEDSLAAMEFDLLRSMASEGQSFIVLGHCAEEVLRDKECLVTVFVSADEDWKLERIQKMFDIDRDHAFKKMKRHNIKRKSYHNSYCNQKWGDSRYYDMCIRSSVTGCKNTADVILEFIEKKFDVKF
jgi:cytidylate kinase